MKNLIKLLALLLTLCMLLPMAIACKKTNDPEEPENPDAPGTETEEPFDVVLRFAVTSDLHLRTTSNDYESYDILQQLFNSAYTYSESQEYNKLDGIFFAGDFTQNGAATEMEKFFTYVNANTKEGTTVRAILGNHEYWESGKYYRDTVKEEPHRYGPKSIAATEAKMAQYGGEAYEDVDVHLVIGGYHFIALNMDMYDGSDALNTKYSAGKLAWLEKELSIAAADDPTGTKPIFVFHHMPATNTVNEIGAYTPDGSRKASDDNLEKIFNKYPQIIDFSGHTHYPITDPRSIWQGGYTAVNTASLAYLGVPIANHPTYDTSYVIALDNNGSWAYGDLETEVRNAKLFYFVEVNAKNELRLVVYNLASESVLMTINIGAVGKPSTYTFNKNRKLHSEAPVFATGAQVSVTKATFSSIVLSIPQAICKDTVNNYRVEVYKDGKLVDTVYRLACQYLGSEAPAAITAPVSNLASGTAYAFKIVPVNTWGVEGDALWAYAETAKLDGELKADLFSIGFNADGTAVNTLTGKALEVTGTPTVQIDSTVGAYVGVFNGTSAYRFTDMPDLYAKMANGFTIETYLYLDKKPASSYIDLVSNQQVGGFGFEMKSSDGKIRFYCHDGSGYKQPSLNMSAGQWVHLVGVFDPDNGEISIYVNGQKASSGCKLNATLQFPAESAQYLCIGGDSDESTGTSFMTGKIATVNLYSFALTDDMVTTLYNSCK